MDKIIDELKSTKSANVPNALKTTKTPKLYKNCGAKAICEVIDMSK